MKKKIIKKNNLSNKEPTKDISKDDIKNKIPLATSRSSKKVKISNDIVFGSNNGHFTNSYKNSNFSFLLVRNNWRAINT